MAIARPLAAVRRLGPIPATAARIAVSGRWAVVAPGLIGFGVVATVGITDGGLFPRAWRLATLALAALAAAALLARRRIAPGRLEWLFAGGLAAYTTWLAISATWSGLPSDSLLEAERALVYAVAAVSVLLVVDRGSRASLLAGVVAGVTVASAYGLAKYVVSPPPLDPYEGTLLYEPLGYANALGIYAVTAILATSGLALAARRRIARLAAAAPLVVLLPTLFYTHSRGAWLALVVGVTVLAYFTLALRPAAVAFVGVAAAAVAVSIVVASRGAVEVTSLAGENRPRYWGLAIEDFQENPVLGSGAGTYADFWLSHRSIEGFARDAHSLYLSSLAELGPLGLVLIAATLAVPLLALRRGDPVLGAAAAGYMAFVVHAGIDWDWELPAVTLAGLLCGSALLASGRGEAAPVSRPTRLVLLAAVLALAVFAAFRFETGPSLPFGP